MRKEVEQEPRGEGVVTQAVANWVEALQQGSEVERTHLWEEGQAVVVMQEAYSEAPRVEEQQGPGGEATEEGN